MSYILGNQDGRDFALRIHLNGSPWASLDPRDIFTGKYYSGVWSREQHWRFHWCCQWCRNQGWVLEFCFVIWKEYFFGSVRMDGPNKNCIMFPIGLPPKVTTFSNHCSGLKHMVMSSGYWNYFEKPKNSWSAYFSVVFL